MQFTTASPPQIFEYANAQGFQGVAESSVRSKSANSDGFASGVSSYSCELRSPEYFTVSYENTSFALYLEPIRNTYHKKYQNIITLSAVPTGPLARMVKQIRPAKLSEFQPVVGERCIYALTRYTCGYNIKDERAYMGAHDLPYIYGYLAANGYQVDTRLTKMTFQSSIDIGSDPYTQEGTRKLICMVSSPIQSLG